MLNKRSSLLSGVALGVVNSTVCARIVQSNSPLDALDLSLPKSDSNVGSTVNTSLNRQSLDAISMETSVTCPMETESSCPVETSCTSHVASLEEHTNPSESRLIIVAPTSKDIRQIKLPYKHVSAGRPKGSIKNTVIGTKRKKPKVRFYIHDSCVKYRTKIN